MENIIESLASSKEDFCESFYASRSTPRYLLGINYSLAKTKKEFSHAGSSVLDEIIAFDLAEVAKAHLGQINMMTVSSFCGPDGLIWGYDVCKTTKERNKWKIQLPSLGFEVNIIDIDPFADAFSLLTGSVTKPNFPFLPGTHIPCAVKQTLSHGKSLLYSGLAIGIPENRKRHACLLMEDTGHIPINIKDVESYKQDIALQLSKSVLKIGEIQGVRYSEILIGLEHLSIDEDEVGCALVAAPYFSLARKAFPKSKNLYDISLSEWHHEFKSILTTPQLNL